MNLKTLLFTILLLIYVCPFVISQEIDRLGIKGGINITRLSIDDIINEDPRLGVNIGLVARLRFTNWIAIQPEINYLTTGATIVYALPEFSGEARVRASYLQLPLMGYLTIFNVFSLQAGIYAAYLTDANYLAEGNFNPCCGPPTQNDFRRFDAGGIGGFEIHFNSIDLGFRYNVGIINVSGARPFLSGARNHIFQAYLTYDFLSLFN